MSILQQMSVDPTKEMAAELKAEETTPTEHPSPNYHDKAKQENAKQFDAEEAETAKAPETTTSPEETKEEVSEDEPETVELKEGEQAPKKLVPLKALQAEREKRTTAEAQAREYERVLAYQQGRAEQYQQPEQQDHPPDKSEDPLGYMDWQDRQIYALQQAQAYQAQERQVAEFDESYREEMIVYGQKNADYPPMHVFLFNGRLNELMAQGIPARQARQQVKAEERNLAWEAQQAGVHPADRIKAIAQARGYVPKPKEEATAPDPAQKVENAKDKARAAVGVAKGGNAPASGMALEDILKLSGAAFDKALAKYESEHGKKPLQFR